MALTIPGLIAMLDRYLGPVRDSVRILDECIAEADADRERLDAGPVSTQETHELLKRAQARARVVATQARSVRFRLTGAMQVLGVYVEQQREEGRTGKP